MFEFFITGLQAQLFSNNRGQVSKETGVASVGV